jgi:hypothetical protein
VGVVGPSDTLAPDRWWAEAGAHWAEVLHVPVADSVRWYRVGDGHFGLQSDDNQLRERVQELYADCACPTPPSQDTAPRLCCSVRVPASAAYALITFDDPEPIDPVAFALAAFPDRGYGEQPGGPSGWRLFGAAGEFAFSGPHLLADRRTVWQGFVGNLAVNRLLRLQREVVFFHAAATLAGDQGVMLMGPKGSGKTTLSLALAARGHAFLGDELIGIRLRTGELVPVRRSATIKPGPAAAAVAAALQRVTVATERFPDGSVRRRVPASRLLPTATSQASRLPSRLTTLMFLEPFAAAPRLQRFHPTPQDVRRLTPLAASLWGIAPERRAMDLVSLLTQVSCYLLRPGAPEETAALIAQTVEG